MSTDASRVDALTSELKSLVEAHPAAAEIFQRQFEMSWILHESALDGIVLTQLEVTQALEQQVVGDASLMSVINGIRDHHAALSHIRSKVTHRHSRPTLPLLVETYQLLVRSQTKDPGLYRKDMPIHRTYTHELSQPEEIEADLQDLFKKLASAEFKEFHPIRQAAYAHWHFMRVFPFAQQNGQLGRLLQTFYLLRAGYEPAIIHQVERQRYHDALRQPPGALRRLLFEAMENSLQSSVRWLERLAEEGEQRTGS